MKNQISIRVIQDKKILIDHKIEGNIDEDFSSHLVKEILRAIDLVGRIHS